jgi:transcription initiation factor TFIIB
LSRDRRPNRAEERLALGELNQFSEKLAVPRAVTDEAAQLCIRGLDRGLAKGRTVVEITASALYAACREKEVPTTLDDVAAASGLERDGIARSYRLLVRELDLKIPIADPAEYVRRVGSRVGVDAKVEADALEILSKAEKAGITAGVYHLGLAASAIYMASMLEGQKLTEKAAADAAEVSEATVRKEYKRLRKVLGE